jgi:hypothetical protein
MNEIDSYNTQTSESATEFSLSDSPNYQSNDISISGNNTVISIENQDFSEKNVYSCSDHQSQIDHRVDIDSSSSMLENHFQVNDRMEDQFFYSHPNSRTEGIENDNGSQRVKHDAKQQKSHPEII